jgi:hypothetical protein
MIRQLFLAALTLMMVGNVTTAHAHSIWIESKDGKLVIHFAEPGSELEKSPGYLDSLTSPVAFIFVTSAPIAVEAAKKTDYFLLVNASPTNTACAESSFTVRGGRKPIFYARWQPSGTGAGTPLLTLDLVPTGKAGEARVYFRGKPLGNVTATLRTPDEKEQEVTADAEGLLRFSSNQSGLHLLTIAHYREPTALAGFHEGVAYQETSHNCALTWRQ